MALDYSRGLNGSRTVIVKKSRRRNGALEVSELPRAERWVVDTSFPERPLAALRNQSQRRSQHARFHRAGGGTGEFLVVPPVLKKRRPRFTRTTLKARPSRRPIWRSVRASLTAVQRFWRGKEKVCAAPGRRSSSFWHYYNHGRDYGTAAIQKTPVRECARVPFALGRNHVRF